MRRWIDDERTALYVLQSGEREVLECARCDAALNCQFLVICKLCLEGMLTCAVTVSIHVFGNIRVKSIRRPTLESELSITEWTRSVERDPRVASDCDPSWKEDIVLPESKVHAPVMEPSINQCILARW